MKVFFDTNVYVAEALLGGAAEQMVVATTKAGWRILSSQYVLDETRRVLTEKLGFSRRLGHLARERVRRRAIFLANGP
jgi:predicted nucleic acid-binding protein